MKHSAVERDGPALDYLPRFPERNPAIGIIGCGTVVKASHLPTYRTHGLRVVGVYDPVDDATRGVKEAFGVERVFDSVEELLGHPDIGVVDIATGPGPRADLMRKAFEAGKHVLAQKPLAANLASARTAVEDAERHGLKLAVNQNGRWAPPWRLATMLVEAGEVGDVVAVTHLLDRDFRFTVGTHYDDFQHLVIYDHLIHWIDITRCWLESKQPLAVRARLYRVPNQPPESASPWGAWLEFEYRDGSSALFRVVGCSATSQPSSSFWVHGTEGTIRGTLSATLTPGPEFVELERDGVFRRFPFEGSWQAHGFAGTMAELLSAIAENREPFNSGRHNLRSLEMTLAASRSADENGCRVLLDERSSG